MNEAIIALPRCVELPLPVEDTILLGLPAERSAKQQLSGSAGDLVRTIATILDQMVTEVIDKRTSQEFKAAFDQTFPPYMQLILSLSSMVSAIVPPQILARLAVESFSELEADIREHAVAAFGADMRDRAIFTVWTLRKIGDLLHAVPPSAKTAECDRNKGREFKSYFLAHALRARFSLDCLMTSMKLKRPIYPEALGVIADGLRSTVEAYAWIRLAVDLDVPPIIASEPPVDWDDEDRDLLSESMLDMDHEQI
jgi:hypothetical protein